MQVGVCEYLEIEANCSEIELKCIFFGLVFVYRIYGQQWSCVNGLTLKGRSLMITALTLMMMMRMTLKLIQTMKVSLFSDVSIVISKTLVRNFVAVSLVMSLAEDYCSNILNIDR